MKPGEENESGEGFLVKTDAGELRSSNVVIATGTFQKPKIPAFSQKISPRISQIHSSLYRNPKRLPPEAVLVVGSGQSGCQITEELYQNGRKTYLCTGKGGRAPRRYHGKDFTWWLTKLGIVDRTVADLDSPAERFTPNPHVTGKDGGHTLNLHQFALDGVTLLGRLQDADGTHLTLADDLKENLNKADAFAKEIKKGVDQYIEKTGMEAPEDYSTVPQVGYDAEVITALDLDRENIRTIIWACGYDHDYRFVKFPIWDQFGYPIQERGVTEIHGLYFLGLHWLHTIKSGLFFGIAEDAEHLAEQIESKSPT